MPSLSASPSLFRCWFRSPPRPCSAPSFSSSATKAATAASTAYREDAFQWLHYEYNSALRWVLRHQWITLSVAIGCAFLNIYLFMIVPKGFFPQQDTGRLGGRTRAAQDISFPAMAEKQKQLAQMVLE